MGVEGRARRPTRLDRRAPVGTANPSSATRVSIGATLEADLDRDAFGDETQDRCIGVAGSDHGCLPAATTPPPSSPVAPPPLVAVSGVTISPTAFHAASSGPSVTNRRTYGARVAFALNQAASVRFTVTRSTTGRTAAGAWAASGSGRAGIGFSRRRRQTATAVRHTVAGFASSAERTERVATGRRRPAGATARGPRPRCRA
jgi:hypothetical protein